MHPTRRFLLQAALAAVALPAAAQNARMPFAQWVAAFRTKAMAHGITPETYTRVMSAVKPDTAGLEAIRNQPEFNEQLWQSSLLAR